MDESSGNNCPCPGGHPSRLHQGVGDASGPSEPLRALSKFPPREEPAPKVRDFGTGATRSLDGAKPDYHGYNSPLVEQRYAQYMLKHQETPAGRRESWNWQMGMPKATYLIGGTRHWQDVRLMMDGYPPDHNEEGYDLEEALCAMIFNAKGLLYEVLLERTGHARPRFQGT